MISVSKVVTLVVLLLCFCNFSALSSDDDKTKPKPKPKPKPKKKTSHGSPIGQVNDDGYGDDGYGDDGYGDDGYGDDGYGDDGYGDDGYGDDGYGDDDNVACQTVGQATLRKLKASDDEVAGKPKPKPKPKPKKRKQSQVITSAPSACITTGDTQLTAVEEEVMVVQSETTDVSLAPRAGLVVMLCGVAVACAVAIIMVIRSPEHEEHKHELLPADSVSL